MANANILAKKQDIVNEIIDKVKNANTVVLFEYRGLTVSEMTELRRKLRETESDVKIFKNTLVQRAMNDLKYDLDEELNGPKAMAYGSDAIAPIKILNEFSKNHPALEIKIGIVDGEVTKIDTLNKLAVLPSRQELLTMVAGGLMGTVRDLSICLDLYSETIEKNN